MKIIDLLNKIANGEEVPKKIKIKDEIWIYDDEIDYKAEDNRGYLFEVHTRINKEDLNDTVEIIEEDKKTEKIPPIERKPRNIDNVYLKEKINKIIDEVNKLKEGKDE